jgi:hypothetical protein
VVKSQVNADMYKTNAILSKMLQKRKTECESQEAQNEFLLWQKLKENKKDFTKNISNISIIKFVVSRT